MKYCSNCRQSVEIVVDMRNGDPCCSICGAILRNAAENRLGTGTILNGFRIEKELGRGGMGVVYLATQMNLNRKVAMKVLSETLSQDSNFVEGFFREARAAASLGHSNIVQAYDAGATPDGIYYFVMELIDGENLDNIIASYGRIELDDALDIAYKIADALAYAWERQKLCHGDIKPENIILKLDGEVKLADLGLAKSYDGSSDDSDEEGDLMATPLYAPPEVIRGEREKIGFRSDMYSYGATLYHIFTGRPPFPGTDPATVCALQLNSQPKPLIGIDRKIPNELSMLVDRLMEKDQNKRPESWRDVTLVLQQIMNRRIEAKEAKEAAMLLAFRKKRIRLFLMILSFLFFAGVFSVVGTVYLLKMRNRFLPIPEKEGAEMVAPAENLVEEETFSVSPIENEWNALSESLGALDRPSAIARLKEFEKKYGSDTPVEAKTILETLEKRVRSEGNLKQLKTQIGEILEDVHSEKTLKSSDIRTIKNFQSLISAIYINLKNYENDQMLTALNAGNRIQIDGYNKKLSARVIELVRMEEKAKEDARIRRQKAEREKKRKELQKQDAQNAAADSLLRAFHAPDSILDVTEFPYIVSALEEWQRNSMSTASDKIQQKYREYKAFFENAAKPLWQILNENEKILKNHVLLPVSFPEYHYESSDVKSLKLNFLDGKVTIGKRISWNLIQSRYETEFYGALLAPDLFNKLTLDSQSVLLCKLFIYFKNQEEADDTLTPGMLSGKSKKVLEQNRMLFSSLTQELNALLLWDEILSTARIRDKQTLRTLVLKMKKLYSSTNVYERRKKELDAYFLSR